jgi:hypothetical protein
VTVVTVISEAYTAGWRERARHVPRITGISVTSSHRSSSREKTVDIAPLTRWFNSADDVTNRVIPAVTSENQPSHQEADD